MSKLKIAIDGNEANIKNRVGSNVYAFEVLNQLYELTKNKQRYRCTILLAKPALADLPKARSNWRYLILKPRRFWTQWALPLHLFWQQKNYHVLFTPGHYAPRFSAIPYVSSVMDLAYLKFPQQFNKHDLYQLKHWTDYSVQKAAKVITISQFSKLAIHDAYHKSLQDIVVAPPAANLLIRYSPLRWKAFLRKWGIVKQQYFLYLGTLQPRKNLITLITAFEAFCHWQAASQLKKKNAVRKTNASLPQLIIAGKLGWLTKELKERIDQTALKEQIILTGFVSEDIKRPLYQNAKATVLVGLYEGFGIPPLESMSVGTPAIVAKTSSLPEVVGNTGWQVDPNSSHDIAKALKLAWSTPNKSLKKQAQRVKKQASQFSWQKTGKVILKTIREVVSVKT